MSIKIGNQTRLLLTLVVAGMTLNVHAAETDFSFTDDYSKEQLLELDKVVHQKLNNIAGSINSVDKPIAIENCDFSQDGDYHNLNVKIRNNSNENILEGLSISFQLLDEQGDALDDRILGFNRVDAGQGVTSTWWIDGNTSTPFEEIASVKIYQAYIYDTQETVAFEVPYVFDGSGTDSPNAEAVVAEIADIDTQPAAEEKIYEGYEDCLALPRVEEVLEGVDNPGRNTHKTSGVLDEIMFRYRVRSDQMAEYVDFLSEYGFTLTELEEKYYNVATGGKNVATLKHTGSEMELSISPDAIDIVNVMPNSDAANGETEAASPNRPEYKGYEDCPGLPSAKEYLGLSSQSKTSSTTISVGGRSISPVVYHYRVGSADMENYVAFLRDYGFTINETGDKSYDVYAGTMELGNITHDGSEMAVTIRPDVIDFTSLDDVLNAQNEVVYTDADTVKNVQEALNNAGFNCGTPDGIAGSGTYAALNAYQEANGLTVENKITDTLLETMGLN